MLKETTRVDNHSGLANTFLVLWLVSATLGRCGALILSRNNHSAAEMAACLAEVLRNFKCKSIL